MTCEAYEPLIALHVEGDLTAAEVAEVERHLDGCAACRAFAAEMQASQRALREHGRVTADPGVLAAVRAGVLAEIERDRRRAAPARPWWEVPSRQLALAASLVLVVGAALLLLRWHPLGRLEPLSRPTPEAPSAVTRAEPPAVVAPVPEPVPELPAGPVVTASAPPRRMAPASPSPEPAPPPGTGSLRPAIRTPDPEPMVIKLVSDDPDLVIYWLVDPEPEEETDHETATT